MRTLTFVLAVLLTACGGGSGNTSTTGPKPVEIICTSVVNGTEPGCVNSTASFSLISNAHAGVIVNGGSVTRQQMMTVSITVTNSLTDPFSGYRESYITPGCNGEPTVLMSAAAVQLGPLSSWSGMTDGLQCAAMPLGAAQMTVILFDSEKPNCQVQGGQFDPPGGPSTVVSCGNTEIDRA